MRNMRLHCLLLTLSTPLQGAVHLPVNIIRVLWPNSHCLHIILLLHMSISLLVSRRLPLIIGRSFWQSIVVL
ncbi:hypothetical protein FB446DRAFT_723519, partial [Lentinula raphanica]